MGCASSSAQGSNEAIENDKQITKNLVMEKRRLENEVKILLLGAGESGKSTVAKQMKIIHDDGFSDDEKSSYKSIIYNNTVASMRVLVAAVEDLGLSFDPANKDAAVRIASGEEYFTGELLTQALADDIKACWADSGIREAYRRSAEFQLNDSAGYYFDNVDRLASPDYLPSVQDVLCSRAKTTGIIETSFNVDKVHFRLMDVGGQRSERKKWMHCFQDVTAVIFCVALSEYDLKLYEDDTTNRILESLKLFKEICNNRWFVDAAIILFLNKKDLFEEKIAKVDLNVTFADYTGGCDYDAALAYLKKKFLSQNENKAKKIYEHVTCATDTKNITVVFQAVQEVIFQSAVSDSGLGI